jgi:hypothetical protein
MRIGGLFAPVDAVTGSIQRFVPALARSMPPAVSICLEHIDYVRWITFTRRLPSDVVARDLTLACGHWLASRAARVTDVP